MKCVAVDLFCGIGGLTHGLQLSGLDVAAGFDIDSSCKYAYESNNTSVFVHGDIENINGSDIDKYYPHDSIKILVGCAPCQPFSKYTQRYRKNGEAGDKWDLLNSFSRIVSEVNPDIVSMENVPELSKQIVFGNFMNVLTRLGYFIDWKVVFCPDYGVPQSRKRLVLLASNIGKIKLISPQYQKNNYKTVRDAIGGLSPISAGETNPSDPLHCTAKLSLINQRRMASSSPGSSWREWPQELRLACHKKHTGRTYPSVYGRMAWDMPAPTITTQFYGYGNGRFGHPEQDRAISLREGAVLQSFPPDYKFVEGNERIVKSVIGRQIGNAVPVNLGKAIGVSIIEHLEENNIYEKKYK